MNISMPQVPIMNFRQALKFDPNSSVSARLDLSDGNNSPATVILKVSSVTNISIPSKERENSAYFNYNLLILFTGQYGTISSVQTIRC
jgi:hypothetical protein